MWGTPESGFLGLTCHLKGAGDMRVLFDDPDASGMDDEEVVETEVGETYGGEGTGGGNED